MSSYTTMPSSHSPGCISIDSAGGILFISASYGTWTIPVRDIIVVGQCTNDNGPFAEDLFWVFVTTDGWYEAPYDAAGSEIVVERLGKLLNASIPPGPMFSAEFSSRVLWPERFLGSQLFDFTPAGTGGALCGCDGMRQRLTDEIEHFVKEHDTQSISRNSERGPDSG
jgi:hypothetical protein